MLHARHLALKRESRKLTLSVMDQIQLQPLVLHRHRYWHLKDPKSILQGFLQQSGPFYKFKVPLL